MYFPSAQCHCLIISCVQDSKSDHYHMSFLISQVFVEFISQRSNLCDSLLFIRPNWMLFFKKYLLFNWNKSHTTNKSLNKHVPFHWILSHISILEAIFQRFYYTLYSYLTTYENILWNILLFSIFTEHFQPAFTLSFFFFKATSPLAAGFACGLFYLFLYTIHTVVNGTLAHCFPLPHHQSIPTGNTVYHVLFWHAWWFGNVLTSLIFFNILFLCSNIQNLGTYCQ